jgi:ElaB/YqjD/DUF883 family membrane-anchored ribosome-binding protein
MTSPATGEVAEDRIDAYLGDGSAMQKLREQADAVVDRIRPQLETAQDFARTDPMKAVLISAAAGAALMAIVGLAVRASSRPSPVRRLERESSRAASYLASMREAAAELADRAQSAAQTALSRGRDAIDRGRDQVERGRDAVDSGRSAFESERKRASDKAHDTQEVLADTWASIRDQAQPLIDKLKPQLDAAVDYAKQDPARTAIGIATAGALVVGLLSLLSGHDDDGF